MTIQFQGEESKPQLRWQRTPGSPIRSHKSYERPANQICHHSGQYLTVEETNPQRVVWLREQHDFPGFKTLDARFQSAAHASEAQHLVWSMPAVRAVGLLIGSLLLLAGIGLLWTRIAQWSGWFEGALIFGAMMVAGAGAVAMLGIGIRLITERANIYHQQAMGERPAVSYFPLFGAYHVEIKESYELNLVNSEPIITNQIVASGLVTVTVHPEPDASDTYRTYRQLYGAHRGTGVGEHLHAGAVAFEGREWVSFTPPIDYDHRIALRQPIEQQFVVAGEPQQKPIHFEVPYRIDGAVLRTEDDPRRGRSKLKIIPQLASFDSYTMHLTFLWSGKPKECFLKECRLEIPSELGNILQVELGRSVYGTNGPEVVWRNLLFENGKLVLAVRFADPLLGPTAPASLEGSYHLVVGGAVSGLQVPPDHVWDPTGRCVTPRAQPKPTMSAISEIKGKLTTHIAVLAEEHEHVDTLRLRTSAETDRPLIKQITHMLTKMGVDIQRIEEAMPRHDPLDSQSSQLRYWDVIGRIYGSANREALDIHVVVSGSTSDTPQPQVQTTIDVRVRCLHDPRNTSVVQEVADTCKLINDNLSSQLPIL
ncbi:hypothetical protein EKD04_022530 [Chloroflexales bacterium ZM16-3]|nr:hypothetical protein [Chloroflexales bacterium ZM16-3]